jgi:hypothetical protein
MKETGMSVKAANQNRTGWGGVLAGVLPFLLFGLAYLIQAAHELGALAGWPDSLVRTSDLIAYGIISFGLALGWWAGFPRWSLAYLGLGLWLGNNFSYAKIYGVRYGFQGWLPLLTGLVVGLLVSRSFVPPLRLLYTIWRDWTRLSFGIFAFAMPVATIVFIDSNFGWSGVAGLGFDTLLLVAGSAAYLRASSTWVRAASLQGAMIVLLLRNFLMGGWFGGPANLSKVSLQGLALILLFWCGLMFIPGLLGLLRRGLGSVQNLRNAS